MKNIFATLLVLFLLVNCSNKQDKNTVPETPLSENTGLSQAARDSVYQIWIPLMINSTDSVLNEWKSFYSEIDSSFSFNKFEACNISKRTKFGASEKDSVDPVYESFFIYSPDKKQYVDIDSYIWVPDKESGNEKQISGFEIDQEVTLVNMDANTEERLEFFGPSAAAEDVSWLNDSIVVLLMWSNDVPSFLIVDLVTDDEVYFQYTNELHSNKNYLMTRIEKKGYHLKKEDN